MLGLQLNCCLGIFQGGAGKTNLLGSPLFALVIMGLLSDLTSSSRMRNA